MDLLTIEESPKIMIIDDVRSNTLLLEKLFRLEGHQNILVIHDPTQALEAIEREMPDVLLLDLNMPVVSGFDIMTSLHEQNHQLLYSLLVITAYQDAESRHRALELGARDFLTKPFDPTEVTIKVRHLLEASRQRKLQELQNSQLKAMLQQRAVRIAELKEEYVLRLIDAMKQKDDETGRHLIRMSNYVFQMAKQLGLEDDYCHKLKYASAMHDIGKLAVPDSILLKKGRLTPEEFEVMKQHTTKGAELLAGSQHETLILAECIALTHHEKWDGSGYPRNLKGEEIPLEGRIVAVCDVFDALTSERPYKRAWSEEEALAEIMSQSGIHFDPVIVQAFSEIYEQIIGIRRKWMD
ncbi:HD domain-containing phosphohydrolase [Paenibacillus sp. sgz500958]|uniref:HD domain-containing phosphohydrolase n=1 Tax=Paenibacillus sp. sgz500958 TaxID=3242475 RepID=UPI0036D2F1FF